MRSCRGVSPPHLILLMMKRISVNNVLRDGSNSTSFRGEYKLVASLSTLLYVSCCYSLVLIKGLAFLLYQDV